METRVPSLRASTDVKFRRYEGAPAVVVVGSGPVGSAPDERVHHSMDEEREKAPSERPRRVPMRARRSGLEAPEGPTSPRTSRFFSWQYARMAVAPLAGAAAFAASQTASDFACAASEHAKASLSSCPPRLSELSRIIPLCTPGEPSLHLPAGIIPSAFARAARARRFPCARTRRERPDGGRSHDRMVFRAN